jgi:serine/threonine protein kinase/tetratricopeptide (TPR) repeat protein
MGEVWQGIHKEQQVPVAIKVLTAIGTIDPVFVSCFQNEVLAASTLDHATIVQVFDQGKLPLNVEEETDGALVAGSPYLAMELARGGTLRNARGQLEWPQIWRVLLRLLEGLAHAHARGVIHRDLKPSNVLLSQKTGGLKLADFGLAAAMEGEYDFLGKQILGTPDYMAPEQIQSQYRDIGPWTDLYALGCLAIALTTGRPPFHGRSTEDTLAAQLSETTTDFKHKCEVPDGFDPWLQTLLEKSPYLRFSRAADAACALKKIIKEKTKTFRVAINPSQLDWNPQGLPEHATGVHNTEGFLSPKEFTQTEVLQPGSRPGDRETQATSAMPRVRPELIVGRLPPPPPTPQSHKSEENHIRQPPLLGTGLGLFGLRFLPIIGREPEQKQLWAALKRTLQHTSAHAIHITGAEGSGKSRLADWLGNRSHETGSATVLKADFSSGGNSCFSIMWARFLRCEGLNRDQSYRRIRDQMTMLGWDSEESARATTELIGPFPDTLKKGPWVRFESDKERFVLLQQFLEAQSRLRPLVFIMDDAAKSETALAFTQHFLDAQAEEPVPVLLVLTSSPSTTPDEHLSLLDAIEKRPEVEVLDVDPLPHGDRHRLVREMLGLDDELAEMVETRTGGNPHFAVQLVGEWVEGNLLTPGKHGFKLRTGAMPPVPADLAAVWGKRVTRALAGEADIRALQLAAVMGLDVDPTEWLNACKHLQTEADPNLRNKLLENHLAVLKRRDGHWRFSHSLVAEALLSSAKKSKFLPQLHSAAAEMLINLPEIQHGRLGRHLYGAQRFEEAAHHLWAGAKQARESVRYNRAWTLISQQEKCLKRLKVPPKDLRWADTWLTKGQIRRSQVRTTAAKKFFTKVLAIADESEKGRILLSSTNRALGEIARLEGQHQRALSLHEKALKTAPKDSKIHAQILGGIGFLKGNQGLMDEAMSFLVQAEDIAVKSKNTDLHLELSMQRCAMLQQFGKQEEAQNILLKLRKAYLKQGRRLPLARCANDLGETSRHLGKIEAAEHYYIEALTSFEAVGSETAWIPRANLGILLAEQGRSLEAREHLERVQRRLQRHGHSGLLGIMHIILTLVASHEQNWAALDRHYEEGTRLINKAQLVDKDVARESLLAGQLCFKAGQSSRALRSLKLSFEHYERMECEEESAQVADLIETIETQKS